MEPLRKPRQPARNTRIRKRPSVRQLAGFPLIIVAIITIVLWISKNRTIGTFAAIGIAGAVTISVLLPNVKTFLTRRLGPAGLVIAVIWAIISLGLCISFLKTASVYAGHGVSWRQSVGLELKRTFLAAVAFGTCVVGCKVIVTAIRRKGRRSCLKI